MSLGLCLMNLPYFVGMPLTVRLLPNLNFGIDEPCKELQKS
jgi:hypothetical protein